MTACHILGISAFYHDSAACLLRDGEIVAAAQEECFTRKKGHLPADHAQPPGAPMLLTTTPIGLIMRAVGRNPSYYRAANGSYWASRDHPRGSLPTSSEADDYMGALFVEFWQFLRLRKKWWLVPLVVVMVLVGALLVFPQGSALAPFIYTIF